MAAQTQIQLRFPHFLRHHNLEEEAKKSRMQQRWLSLFPICLFLSDWRHGFRDQFGLCDCLRAKQKGNQKQTNYHNIEIMRFFNKTTSKVYVLYEARVLFRRGRFGRGVARNARWMNYPEAQKTHQDVEQKHCPDLPTGPLFALLPKKVAQKFVAQNALIASFGSSPKHPKTERRHAAGHPKDPILVQHATGARKS
jgi:hypothetical protein